MGTLLLDQYMLLHYATGVMFYFWGFSFLSFYNTHIV